MAVSKAIASGRISVVIRNGKRWVDVDAANVAWAARTDPVQQERGAPLEFAKTEALANASAKKMGEDTASTARVAAGEPRNVQRATSSRTLLEEKTRYERLRVEKHELDLAERRGELLSRSGLERALGAKLIAARELFEAIPDRLAAPIAATSDPHAVRKLLADEIFIALTLLSTVRDDVAQYRPQPH